MEDTDSAQDAVWKLDNGHAVAGPYSKSKLAEFVASGHIQPDTEFVHIDGRRATAQAIGLFDAVEADAQAAAPGTSSGSESSPRCPPPPPDAKPTAPKPPPPPDATDVRPAAPKGNVTAYAESVGKFFGGLVLIAVLALRFYTMLARPESSEPPHHTSKTKSSTPKTASSPSRRFTSRDDSEGRTTPDSELNYDYLLERGRPSKQSTAIAKSTRPRVTMRWVEATEQLMAIVARMTPQQQAALGVAALTSGFDIYGAQVTLTNIGQRSVQVSPAKLRVHFGNETALVSVGTDRVFLKPMLLPPGRSVTGLVMFTARADIGAAIRFGDGAMSYRDSNVDVNYTR